MKKALIITAGAVAGYYLLNWTLAIGEAIENDKVVDIKSAEEYVKYIDE